MKLRNRKRVKTVALFNTDLPINVDIGEEEAKEEAKRCPKCKSHMKRYEVDKMSWNGKDIVEYFYECYSCGYCEVDIVETVKSEERIEAKEGGANEETNEERG